MNPVVFSVGGLHDGLIEVCVLDDPVEPAVEDGPFHRFLRPSDAELVSGGHMPLRDGLRAFTKWCGKYYGVLGNIDAKCEWQVS